MWLMTRLAVDEEAAILIGQKLQYYNYIYRVKDLDNEPFTNSTDIYKLYVCNHDHFNQQLLFLVHWVCIM